MQQQQPTPPTLPDTVGQAQTQAPAQEPKQQHRNEIVGRVNFQGTQLFEATGFIDISKEFPTGDAFLMFVPGIPDTTKQTGRSYDQSKRETMKVSVRDLYGMAEALKYAAVYQQCDFVLFTDSSKFSGTAQGEGQTKQVSINAQIGNNQKLKVFLSFKGRGGKVTLALEKWHAMGLSNQLTALADRVQNRKFDYDYK